jgi:hypothetical protein
MDMVYNLDGSVNKDVVSKIRYELNEIKKNE